MAGWLPHGPIYDDFRTLAAGTLLDGRTTDSGHTWVNMGNATDWHVINDSAPAGNVAQGDAVSSFNRLAIEFGTADVDIEATLHLDLNDLLGAGLSLRNATSTYYEVNASLNGVISVIRVDNALAGSSTVVQEWTGLHVNDKAVLRCVTSGSTFDVYLNGTHVGTATDGTYTGTSHGIQQRFAGEAASVKFYAFNLEPPPGGWAVGMVRW